MRATTLLGFLAGVSALGLIAASALASDDSVARKALASARKRQDAQPGYVEHVIGYFPIMPGATQVLTGMVTDRLKAAALDEVRNKVAMATVKVPIAGEAVDRALNRIEDRATAATEAAQNGLLETVGPEREIGLVQHSGKVVRRVYADGYLEIVQNESRKAVRYNLSTQIALLRAQEAVTLTEAGIAEVKSVRATIKEISFSLAKQTVAGSFGDAVAIFDRVSELLALAHTAKALNQAAALLEKVSGTWQCEPAPLTETYTFQVISAEQLPDETRDGTPVHVYREFWTFPGMQVSNSSLTDDDDKPVAAPQLQRHTWVRISDGLPVRVELSLPGGSKQTMNYEYPAKVEFVLPPCLAAP